MNEILLCLTEGTAEQYAKPHKPGREEQIPHAFTNVCSAKGLNS